MKNWIPFIVLCGIIFLFHNCKKKEDNLHSKDRNEEIRQSVQTETNLIIHTRGVYECEISLLKLAGNNNRQSVSTLVEKNCNGADSIIVPGNYLPGEFILRFDYKEKSGSTSYPSEKFILISTQDLELWVNPKYCNNPDSTFFQKGEKENTIYHHFFQKNAEQKKIIGLLQDLLMNYDEPASEFYLKGVEEYNRRRIEHNQWIKEQIIDYENLFVSNLFQFQKIPKIELKDTQLNRNKSLRDNYFNDIDLNNSLLIKTTALKEWIDGYVNLYAEIATSKQQRDSLLVEAGVEAIKKAKLGHPVIYGWMVDYFFRGYESLNIEKGIFMLQPYLNDPACLTSQKQAIQKRVEGLEKIIPGEIAPNFQFNDNNGDKIMFHSYKTSAQYKLVVFWSTDCWHCVQLVEELYPWYLKENLTNDIDVFAVCIPDNLEKNSWKEKIFAMPAWKHMLDGGVSNSEVANAYCILSTPVLVLVDARNNKILALPETIGELSKALNTPHKESV